MKDTKVKNFINEKIDAERKYYPRQVFKDLEVKVYNGSFGSITITIMSQYGYVSGYVSNYEAVEEKVNDFCYRACFNLYEEYWRKHHKQ